MSEAGRRTAKNSNATVRCSVGLTKIQTHESGDSSSANKTQTHESGDWSGAKKSERSNQPHGRTKKNLYAPQKRAVGAPEIEKSSG